MLERNSMRNLCRFLVLSSLLVLAGCAAKRPVTQEEVPVRPPEATHVQDLEKQLSDRQKQCAEERRKLEIALRDAQRRNEETQRKLDDTQRKLDAVVGIERERSSRRKAISAAKTE